MAVGIGGCYLIYEADLTDNKLALETPTDRQAQLGHCALRVVTVIKVIWATNRAVRFYDREHDDVRLCFLAMSQKKMRSSHRQSESEK